MATFTQVDQGTGEIQVYSDTFGNISEEDIERAQYLEQCILEESAGVEIGYLRMARHLSEFKADNLFLARGFETFRLWADSPDLKRIGYRSAQRLVQIADEAIPMLEKYGLMEQLPPISTLGDLLPLLNDDDGEKKFVEAVKMVEGMSNRDAKRYVREVRGLPPGLNGDGPTFRAKVTRGETVHKITITCEDGDGDFYEAGKMQVRVKHFAAFEKLFNERFIEYVD